MDPAAIGTSGAPGALPEDGVGTAKAAGVAPTASGDVTEAAREAARLAAQKARPFMNISTGFTAAGMQALVQQAFADAQRSGAEGGGESGAGNLTLPGSGGAAAPGGDAALIPAKDVKKLDVGKLKKGDGVVKLQDAFNEKSFPDERYAEELNEKYGEGSWQVLDAAGNQLEPGDAGFREGAHALWVAHINKKVFQGMERATEFKTDLSELPVKVDVRMDKKGEKAQAVVGGLGLSNKPTDSAEEITKRIEDTYKVDIQDGTKAWTSEDLARLEESLKKLSPAEQKLLDGVVIKRDEQIPQTEEERKKDGDLAGTYQGGSPNVLTLDDTAFASKELAVQTIIHEIGHGVHTNVPGVLDAFKDADKKAGALTIYGQHSGSIKERFAEAFAIWKTDPDFLREQAPEIAKFFDEGKHLPKKK